MGGKQLGRVQLCLQSWQDLEVRLFDHERQKWIVLQAGVFEPIKDICEFERIDDKLSLKGFGANSGLWIEYSIKSPHVECLFEELIKSYFIGIDETRVKVLKEPGKTPESQLITRTGLVFPCSEPITGSKFAK